MHLGPGRLILALQPGIMASSNVKCTDEQINLFLSEQTLHSQLCLQCAWGEENYESLVKCKIQFLNEKYMKALFYLHRLTYKSWHLLSLNYLLQSIQNNPSSRSKTKQQFS